MKACAEDPAEFDDPTHARAECEDLGYTRDLQLLLKLALDITDFNQRIDEAGT